MTAALHGYGTVFAVGDGGGPEVFTAIAEVLTVPFPGFSRDMLDATHMASTGKFREFVAGLRDGGEMSITLNFVPGDASSDLLFNKADDDTASNFKITFPNAEAWTFAGFLTGISGEAPHDGKITATATFRVTGKPGWFA